MRRQILFLAIGGAAIVALAASRAGADASAVDLRTFRPSTDKSGSLATEGVETPGAGNLQFLGWMSFSTMSLKVHEANGSTSRALGPQLLLDPAVSLGVGKRLAFGATFPVALAQDGGASSLTNGATVGSQGLGDLTLDAKVTAILPKAEALSPGFGLGFVYRQQLPTGDRTNFVSDSAAVSELKVLASYDYVHTLFANVSVGYRMRWKTHDVVDVTLGDVIPWGITLGFRPKVLGWDKAGHWTWMLEAHGELASYPNKPFADSRTSSAFFGPSIRYGFASDYWLFAGVETGLTEALGAPKFRAVFGFTYAPVIVDEDEDGVPDSVDECPGLPGDKGGPLPGCPAHDDHKGPSQSDELGPPSSDELGPPTDSDNDTIPDDKDKCPNDPETFDGIDDADGCPEKNLPPDRDRDGVADDKDKCPDQPETINGYEDDDGCPELDADADTFLDEVDKCPNAAETFNGVDDDDGCPETPPQGKTKVAGAIELLASKPKDAAGEPSVAFLRAIAFDGNVPAASASSDLRALGQWILAHPGVRVEVAVKPESGTDAAATAKARGAELASAIVRDAHTGGAAVGREWNAALAPKGTNVEVFVAKEFGLDEGTTEK